jgi:hypothetical protein
MRLGIPVYDGVNLLDVRRALRDVQLGRRDERTRNHFAVIF